MKKHIPNFITSLNLVSGFIAIIFAINGDLVTGSWFIVAAMVFDFLDGFSARLLKAYSQVGKELDSLADEVSFGVAPAILIYKLLELSQIPGVFIVLVPSIMPVCAAIRLAIFNTDETQSTSFKGLPTPANALAVVSLIIAGNYTQNGLPGLISGSPVVIIIFTLALSLLMVTRIPLLSLKTSHVKFKGNEGRYLLILMVAVVLAIFGFEAAILIIPIYIAASVISLLFWQ